MKSLITSALMVVMFVSTGMCQETKAPPQDDAKTQVQKEKKEKETKTVQPKKAAPVPVKIEANMVKISPANTKVSFVGTHVGPIPDPKARLGGFNKFDGKIEMNADGKTLKGMMISFDTASLSTPMPSLDEHLKGADFFDVKKFPKASFVSKKIEATDKKGVYKVTGTMSMMGKEAELTIPAEISVNGNGLLMKSKFMFDRSVYGMGKMTEKVNRKVAVTLSVGEKTGGAAAAPPRRGGQGQGRGGRDPSQFFATMDKDGDGKLSGDEIPERMRGRLEMLDTDKDGAVSLDEMKEMMSRFGGRRGNGQQGGRPGGNRPGSDGG